MNKLVFITGVKHSGKTTLGKLISDKYSSAFIDLDKYIEDSLNMPVREYYNEFGKEAFMKKEAEALDNLLKSNFKGICATGGGICDNREAFEKVVNNGINIYIHQEWDTLFKRIERGGLPSFIDKENPKESFRNLFDHRDSLYQKGATFTVSGINKTPYQLLCEVTSKLKEL